MNKEEMEMGWNGLSAEIISGMIEWRQQHPKATFREIEAEVDERLARLRARMLSDAAVSQAQADWEEMGKCPQCGVELKVKGKKKRKLLTRGGQEVELERAYGVCPKCGQGFFPLDEALELLPGVLTPHGHECLVRLGRWMPFEQAAEMLDDFLGIKVSRSMSQRYTEAAGEAYEHMQDEEAERLEKEAPVAEAGADKMQVSVDGAMVPLLHGVWAEVKTLVVGEVQPPVEERGERVVHTKHLSYFSRQTNAAEFQRLALVEMHRRGVENAKAVAAVMDGAEWEQGFIDYHCPHAVRILDFAHAAEHINHIGEALFGENTSESQAWLQERLHRLKHTGPDNLLEEFRTLQQQFPHLQTIADNLAYLEKRKEQIQYPQFQAHGWPIGSGIVESGNKLVVEARLKGSGMHWAATHVNPMLALRNIICSDRWKEEWPKIEARLRQQTRQRREQVHRSHLPLFQPSQPAHRIPNLDPALVSSLSAHIEQTDSPTKPKKSPWRNFKCGKALYQPPLPPKI